jgi:hypothetical protein
MELEVVYPKYDQLPFSAKDYFIDKWMRVAKEHNCDKVSFVLAEKKIENAEIIRTESVFLNPLEQVLMDYMKRTFPEHDLKEMLVRNNEGLVDLAQTTTEDNKHIIQVSLSIQATRIIYMVDSKVVHIDEYPTAGLMATALNGVEFDDLIHNAEVWWLTTQPAKIDGMK